MAVTRSPIPTDMNHVGTCSGCGGRVVESKRWVTYKVKPHCWDCGAKVLEKPVVEVEKK